MGTPKAPRSLPWTPPGASESLDNELLDIENLHFSTPRLLKTQAKSLFLLVRGLRKSLFLAFKIAYKSMFFQHAFGICDFIIFYTTTHLFGLQLGPQLGVKNPSCFLIFVSWTEQTQWEPPKAPQSLLWTPWGPRENLENEPLENEILHFACPWPIENTNKKQNTQAFAEPLKTQTKNRTHKLLPPPPAFDKNPDFITISSNPVASAHCSNTPGELYIVDRTSGFQPFPQNLQYLYSIYCFCARRISEPPKHTVTISSNPVASEHCSNAPGKLYLVDRNSGLQPFPESAIFVFHLLLLRTTRLGASTEHRQRQHLAVFISIFHD